MKVRSFIGKTVDLKALDDMDLLGSHYDPGEYDETHAVAEILLHDFQVDGFYDSTGRNAYSVVLYLDGERIVKIERVGHCHMKAGQGSDEVLKRFPYASLEEEADAVIREALK